MKGGLDRDRIPKFSQEQFVGIVAILCALTVFQGTIQLVSPVAFIEQFNLTDVETAQVQASGMYALLAGFGLTFYTGYVYRYKVSFSWRYHGISCTVALTGVALGTSIALIVLSMVFLIGFFTDDGVQEFKRYFTSE